MSKVVFLRHGESVWNKKNIFTGWTDVELTEAGEDGAREAGKLLKEKGFIFDVAFTSFLGRANKTLELVLKEMDINIPVEKSWRLNERHYGALQGLNKREIAKERGEDVVFKWRRSYKERPPKLSEDDPRHSSNDSICSSIERGELPNAESLEDMILRTLPYWREVVVPKIKEGKDILIVGHGTNIRGMRKYLENISDKDIEDIDIPYTTPLVYEFDENVNILHHYYLGDEDKINKTIDEIKGQIK